jgi:hypothetical protein
LPTQTPPFRERCEHAADAHWISSAIGLDKAVVDHCGRGVVWKLTHEKLVAPGEALAIAALVLCSRHCGSAPWTIFLRSSGGERRLGHCALKGNVSKKPDKIRRRGGWNRRALLCVLSFVHCLRGSHVSQHEAPR